MGFGCFFLGCTFFGAFFPGMPLELFVLENVSWWYWGAGYTAQNAGFEDLTTGILHFWFLGFPGNSGIIWVFMFFSRLYILLCILSRNAFGHFGLGKCKLVILRCRFHCKNAGFEDLTTGILQFWFLGFPGNPGIIWVLMVFVSRLYILLCILSRKAFGHFGLGKCKLVILRCRFHCKNAGFEDLATGILHFWFLGFPGNSSIIWVLIVFFSRLYILLCILSRNAFGAFGLGKCKLVILRCRFHCKNASFEDLTTGILHFWFLGFPGNSGIIWVLIVFFLGCTFCCAFFPAMPLDILVLENVSWWYWGAGSTANMQVLKTLQQGSYIFGS